MLWLSVSFLFAVPSAHSLYGQQVAAAPDGISATTPVSDEKPSTSAPDFTASAISTAPQPIRMDSSSFDGEVFLAMPEGSAGAAQIKVVDQRPEPPRTGVEQEVLLEGLYSYGNYKIFASGYDDKLYTAGVEYNRHSWGYFLKGQMDYVAEFLPFVLLNKPLHTDQWGNPIPPSEKNIRQQIYGIGFSPIGFRLQWRSNSRIRPFLEAKGGMLGFTKKAPAAQATYENFSLESMGGVQLKLNDRWGVRLGLFGDFHFSNAFIVPANPGLDVMNANLAVSYHF